ncbi:MAG TPA: Tat pathway signal protein [Verrucomicrobiae bacterium]|nr:Tat pathway signal protein [Verrucomicrobiae bacterium]
MNRRRFLQNLAVTPAAIEAVDLVAADAEPAPPPQPAANLDGYTQLAEFHLDNAAWKAYEDLRTRDGSIVFVGPRGQRVLTKSAEACFATAEPPFLGLPAEEIGRSGPDMLADELLKGGDPDPERVRAAAPPLGAGSPGGANGGFSNGAAGRWTTFLGTKECSDTMPVFPMGNTRTYHPNQYFPELNVPAGPGRARGGQPATPGPPPLKRWEGMLGGWLPVARKIIEVRDAPDAYIEMLIFGDVEAKDRFIVQTWHRTARIENGKVVKVVYGYSYPAYPPFKLDPKPEEFYRALLVFANYWDKLLHDYSATTLPDNSYVDMAKHAFAKEIMVRPGGVYPKYGAVDRDYYGSEYDGFQDTFTMAVYANLECGRLDVARDILDNYLTDFTAANGSINMRGPETAQFGLTLSLIARYYNYTRDAALLAKHRGKIEATAANLLVMHDTSLKLPKENPGYGLIAGWSESDSALNPRPATWWQPYFANSAFTARGLKDIARIWNEAVKAPAAMTAEWQRRSKVLADRVAESMRANTLHDKTPPYIGPLPGSKLTFRESMQQERPSPQQWPHRPYAELLEADMIPADLANLTIDTMRAYGATTIGVVANVGGGGNRAILGFISYGYALELLRLDRVEEYLLFLYSHRFHDHTPGSWTAGEVSGINGGTATFCIPAQQTIPLLVRWMLVLEDNDADRLYFAKAVPREWTVSGKEIRIEKAPTRWGRVDFNMAADTASQKLSATVALPRGAAPEEVHVKLRVPPRQKVANVTVNGRAASLVGPHNDTVIVKTGTERRFEIRADLT